MDMSNCLKKHLENFVIDQKVAGNSKRTVEYYQDNVTRFINWLETEFNSTDISFIKLNNIKLYTLHLKESNKLDPRRKKETDEPLSDVTVRTYLRAVKCFISYLSKEGFIDENLPSKIKLPKARKKQIDILDDQEIQMIINVLKKKKTNHYRDLAIMYLFLETGARLNEVVTLKLPNIKFNQNILKVLGKGDKERYIQYGVNVQRMLMKYINFERPQPINKSIDYVFLKADGYPITQHTVKNLFRRIKEWTGIEKLHPHLCRHTMITMSLMNGENPFMLKSKTRHSDFKIIENYYQAAGAIQNKNNYSLMDNLNIK